MFQAIQRSTLITGDLQALPSSLRSSLKEADLATLRQRLQQMQEGRDGPVMGGLLEGNAHVEGQGESRQTSDDPSDDSSEGGDGDKAAGISSLAGPTTDPGDGRAWPRRGLVAPSGFGVCQEAAESPTRSSLSVASAAAVEHVVRHLQEEGVRRSAEVMSMLGGLSFSGGGVYAHPLEGEVDEETAEDPPRRQLPGYDVALAVGDGSSSSLATWFAGVSSATGHGVPPAGNLGKSTTAPCGIVKDDQTCSEQR